MVNFKEKLRKINSFVLKCKRVWHILRKPTKKEFQLIAKVSAIAIILLGFIGFLVSVIIKSFF